MNETNAFHLTEEVWWFTKINNDWKISFEFAGGVAVRREISMKRRRYWISIAAALISVSHLLWILLNHRLQLLLAREEDEGNWGISFFLIPMLRSRRYERENGSDCGSPTSRDVLHLFFLSHSSSLSFSIDKIHFISEINRDIEIVIEGVWRFGRDIDWLWLVATLSRLSFSLALLLATRVEEIDSF